MIRKFLFLALTFFLAWLFQEVFLYLAPATLPSPHWLLLLVLALGGRGHINIAQTMGFFWGLALDVHGATPFGTQAFLLALAGFGSGALARELNAEKTVTQEALAFVGTVVFLFGAAKLMAFFGSATGPQTLGAGVIFAEIALNLLAAPAVFRAAYWWLDLGNFWTAEPAPR